MDTTGTISQLPIPLALPRRNAVPATGIRVLAGDIGGTKTNLAVYQVMPEGIKLLQGARYPSAEYQSLIILIKHFLAENNLRLPDRISLGVAGPVLNGKVDITNLTWVLDQAEIARDTGVKEVVLINDLEAMAYGLAALQAEDFITIHGGKEGAVGNMAIIAPGTGLGEAGLYWNGKAYFPFPTEGGHCDFSPRTDLDMELCKYLQQQGEVVSWEKVIAGPAITSIYTFLRDVKKREEPAWLAEQLAKEKDDSAVISQNALHNKAAICVETMDLFVRYIARETANLVLKMKATGGIFLGGGIPPKIAPLLLQEAFYRHYMDCDRMQHLLEGVPIRIIKNDKTGLLGAAFYGAYGEW
ncbi:glucokinase [Pseudoflavitalea sp. X16]|uniref:glucokinase n=1 Tax=Paraflavitalea devenefica TaxID=2716334 RepID=UPI001420ED0A|nr:glucokinase [Paraflavitalea devenefica]NII26866.1 glucokinase [Paraflavitalea devenefica]